jgi:hypothetical protein
MEASFGRHHPELPKNATKNQVRDFDAVASTGFPLPVRYATGGPDNLPYVELRCNADAQGFSLNQGNYYTKTVSETLTSGSDGGFTIVFTARFPNPGSHMRWNHPILQIFDTRLRFSLARIWDTNNVQYLATFWWHNDTQAQQTDSNSIAAIAGGWNTYAVRVSSFLGTRRYDVYDPTTQALVTNRTQTAAVTLPPATVATEARVGGLPQYQNSTYADVASVLFVDGALSDADLLQACRYCRSGGLGPVPPGAKVDFQAAKEQLREVSLGTLRHRTPVLQRDLGLMKLGDLRFAGNAMRSSWFRAADLVGDTWPSLTPDTPPAVVAANVQLGLANGILAAYGNSAVVTLPTLETPEYTLCHVAKFGDGDGDARDTIVTGNVGGNVFHSGFLAGNAGVAVHGGNLITDDQNVHGNAWVVSTDTWGRYRSNRVDRTTGPPGAFASFAPQLGNAAWHVAEIVQFSVPLDSDATAAVETYLDQRNCVSLPQDALLHLDASDVPVQGLMTTWAPNVAIEGDVVAHMSGGFRRRPYVHCPPDASISANIALTNINLNTSNSCAFTTLLRCKNVQPASTRPPWTYVNDPSFLSNPASVSLNGTNQFMDGGGPLVANLSQGFSWCVHCKINALESSAEFDSKIFAVFDLCRDLSSTGSGKDEMRFLMNVGNSTTITVWWQMMSPTSDRSIFSSTITQPFTLGEYACFVGRYTASTNAMQIWKDGSLWLSTLLNGSTQGSMPNTTTLTFGSTLLGRFLQTATNHDEYANIDYRHFFVFNRSLTDAEIASLTNYCQGVGNGYVPADAKLSFDMNPTYKPTAYAKSSVDLFNAVSSSPSTWPLPVWNAAGGPNSPAYVEVRGTVSNNTMTTPNNRYTAQNQVAVMNINTNGGFTAIVRFKMPSNGTTVRFFHDIIWVQTLNTDSTGLRLARYYESSTISWLTMYWMTSSGTFQEANLQLPPSTAGNWGTYVVRINSALNSTQGFTYDPVTDTLAAMTVARRPAGAVVMAPNYTSGAIRVGPGLLDVACAMVYDAPLSDADFLQACRYCENEGKGVVPLSQHCKVNFQASRVDSRMDRVGLNTRAMVLALPTTGHLGQVDNFIAQRSSTAWPFPTWHNVGGPQNLPYVSVQCNKDTNNNSTLPVNWYQQTQNIPMNVTTNQGFTVIMTCRFPPESDIQHFHYMVCVASSTVGIEISRTWNSSLTLMQAYWWHSSSAYQQVDSSNTRAIERDWRTYVVRVTASTGRRQWFIFEDNTLVTLADQTASVTLPANFTATQVRIGRRVLGGGGHTQTYAYGDIASAMVYDAPILDQDLVQACRYCESGGVGPVPVPAFCKVNFQAARAAARLTQSDSSLEFAVANVAVHADNILDANWGVYSGVWDSWSLKLLKNGRQLAHVPAQRPTIQQRVFEHVQVTGNVDVAAVVASRAPNASQQYNTFEYITGANTELANTDMHSLLLESATIPKVSNNRVYTWPARIGSADNVTNAFVEVLDQAAMVRLQNPGNVSTTVQASIATHGGLTALVLARHPALETAPLLSLQGANATHTFFMSLESQRGNLFANVTRLQGSVANTRTILVSNATTTNNFPVITANLLSVYGLTYDNATGNIEVYKNGVVLDAAATRTSVGTAPEFPNFAGTVTIGNQSNALIRCATVYDRVLSATEMHSALTFATRSPYALYGLSNEAFANVLALYSLRKATPYYDGPVVHVRHGSLGITRDFFASADGALGLEPYGRGMQLRDWLAGNTGHVVAWYDQGGRDKHLTQLTEALQPTLVQDRGGAYAVYLKDLQTIAGPDIFTSNTVTNMECVMHVKVLQFTGTRISFNGTRNGGQFTNDDYSRRFALDAPWTDGWWYWDAFANASRNTWSLASAGRAGTTNGDVIRPGQKVAVSINKSSSVGRNRMRLNGRTHLSSSTYASIEPSGFGGLVLNASLEGASPSYSNHYVYNVSVFSHPLSDRDLEFMEYEGVQAPLPSLRVSGFPSFITLYQLNQLSGQAWSNLLAVYSLTKATPTYMYSGPVVKLRRGSTTQDFYANAPGTLTTEVNGRGLSAKEWRGVNEAHVVTWYDQSGRGKHLVQPNTTLQPKLVIDTGGAAAVYLKDLQTMGGPDVFTSNTISDMECVIHTRHFKPGENVPSRTFPNAYPTLISFNGRRSGTATSGDDFTRRVAYAVDAFGGTGGTWDPFANASRNTWPLASVARAGPVAVPSAQNEGQTFAVTITKSTALGRNRVRFQSGLVSANSSSTYPSIEPGGFAGIVLNPSLEFATPSYIDQYVYSVTLFSHPLSSSDLQFMESRTPPRMPNDGAGVGMVHVATIDFASTSTAISGPTVPAYVDSSYVGVVMEHTSSRNSGSCVMLGWTRFFTMPQSYTSGAGLSVSYKILSEHDRGKAPGAIFGGTQLDQLYIFKNTKGYINCITQGPFSASLGTGNLSAPAPTVTGSQSAIALHYYFNSTTSTPFVTSSPAMTLQRSTANALHGGQWIIYNGHTPITQTTSATLSGTQIAQALFWLVVE